MDTIITATGKEFETDYLSVIPYPAQMFLRILNTPIEIVAKIFSNSLETCKIQYCNQSFEGYTSLVVLIPEGEAIKVCLAKL